MRKPDNNLIEFTTPTDPELSIIDGRNGTYHINKLYVWESHDHTHVYLEGIGKRGVAIKGGLRVTLECFADACRKFLDEEDQTAAMRKLLQSAIDRWPEIESEEPISGADAVDWLVEFLRDANKTLAAIKRGGG